MRDASVHLYISAKQEFYVNIWFGHAGKCLNSFLLPNTTAAGRLFGQSLIFKVLTQSWFVVSLWLYVPLQYWPWFCLFAFLRDGSCRLTDGCLSHSFSHTETSQTEEEPVWDSLSAHWAREEDVCHQPENSDTQRPPSKSESMVLLLKCRISLEMHYRTLLV